MFCIALDLICWVFFLILVSVWWIINHSWYIDCIQTCRGTRFAAAQIDAHICATVLCLSACHYICTLLQDMLSCFGQTARAQLFPAAGEPEQQGNKWSSRDAVNGNQSISLEDQASICSHTCYFAVLCHLFFSLVFLLPRNLSSKFCPCAVNLQHRVMFCMCSSWCHKLHIPACLDAAIETICFFQFVVLL